MNPVGRDPDAGFADPRLAATYDVFEGERHDLPHYEVIVAELGAAHVLDVGCGTGEFALRLAARGLHVTGVDPAAASVAIARRKPGAEDVTWIVGTIDDVPVGRFDLAVMTGNVAQVFLGDDEWSHVVARVHASLRPGGWFVFETRDPAAKSWERWTPEATRAVADLPDGERAETWCTVTDVAPPFVSFRYRTTFSSDGTTSVSDSTLRFRSREELDASLDAAGFHVTDVRDAPDRPGVEWVYVCRRR